jgi:hypothetical protein
VSSAWPDGAPVHQGGHRPEWSALYRWVQHHAATFFAQTEDAAGADATSMTSGPDADLEDTEAVDDHEPNFRYSQGITCELPGSDTVSCCLEAARELEPNRFIRKEFRR